MKHYPNPDDTETCVQQIKRLRTEIARLRGCRIKIKERIEGLASDSRLKKPALVDVNAPLALMQCSMEGELKGLRFALRALEARL